MFKLPLVKEKSWPVVCWGKLDCWSPLPSGAATLQLSCLVTIGIPRNVGQHQITGHPLSHLLSEWATISTGPNVSGNQAWYDALISLTFSHKQPFYPLERHMQIAVQLWGWSTFENLWLWRKSHGRWLLVWRDCHASCIFDIMTVKTPHISLVWDVVRLL